MKTLTKHTKPTKPTKSVTEQQTKNRICDHSLTQHTSFHHDISSTSTSISTSTTCSIATSCNRQGHQ
jgi:hypothetical protein